METLYIVATPIGNLEDITIRAIKTLLTVSVIACEDTRRTGQLLKIISEKWAEKLGVSSISHRFISIRDWNEVQAVSKVMSALQTSDVALVSDGGTPLISDPGFKLVRAARQAKVRVIPIPGPSAAIAALSASGLPTDKFVFIGFLPKKGDWNLFPNITNIIYESPKRASKTLDMIHQKYPTASLVVAHELTKTYEMIVSWDWSQKWNLMVGELVILVNFSQSSRQEV